MSTKKQIMEVFDEDVAQKIRSVYQRRGIMPFLQGKKDLQVHRLFGGVCDETDEDFLASLTENGSIGEEDG